MFPKASEAILAAILLHVFALAGHAVPGEHDEEVQRLLRQINKAMPLRTTALKDLAPEFVVEKGKDMNWADAVAQANARFGNRQPERALFLWKHLEAGLPESRLNYLHLPEGEWVAIGLGAGGSVTKTFALSSITGTVADIRVTLGHSDNLGYSVILRDPVLELQHFKLGDLLFESLVFDANDKLVDWRCPKLSTASKDAVLRLGPILRGDGTATGWSASLDKNSAEYESIEYNLELVIQKRRGWFAKPGEPPSTANENYRETYQDGKLKKRVHLGTRTGKTGGTETFVEREENFR